MPEKGINAPQTDEWIVILGGTGTVGQFAVQVTTTALPPPKNLL